MDSLYEAGLEMTRWLQLQFPQLATPMLVITMLGLFEFYMALLPLLYWCVNKRFGKEVTYLLAVTNLLNAVGKHLLRQPRPLFLDEALGLRAETSFGAPSGHVQLATVLYIFTAIRAQRRLVWFLAVVGILLMTLSRIYVGAHFLLDAIVGFLLGMLVLAGYYVWRHRYQDVFKNRLIGQRLLIGVTFPLFIAFLYGIGLLLIGALSDVAWLDAAQVAERVSLEEVFSAVGMLLGLGIGFILEASRVHFVVDGSWVTRAIRYVLGMIGTIIIWRGLALVFPEEPLWLGLPLRLLRYWLASMWVAYYAPLLFVRIGLAQASPEPDVTLGVSEGGIMSE